MFIELTQCETEKTFLLNTDFVKVFVRIDIGYTCVRMIEEQTYDVVETLEQITARIAKATKERKG